MSNYTKFDLNTIKEKLKSGAYASRVGAMRAIGKTQSLSEDDKEKARALVAKHFPDDAPAPKASKAPKKAAKKAATKKAPTVVSGKKASKKVMAKKTAKKAARRAKSVPPPPPEGDTETSQLAVADNSTKTSTATAPSRAAIESVGVVGSMGQVISTVAESLRAMEAAKRIFPKGHFDVAAENAAHTLARAVRVIDQEVVAPSLAEEQSSSTSSSGSSRKKAPKKGTRAKVTTAAPPPAEDDVDDEQEEQEEHEEIVPNGSAPELSDEEQEQLELARQTQTHS